MAEKSKDGRSPRASEEKPGEGCIISAAQSRPELMEVQVSTGVSCQIPASPSAPTTKGQSHRQGRLRA